MPTVTGSWTATLWYDDIQPVDHADEGASNLLWQYQGKPRVEAFLEALLDLVDDLEDVAVDVLVGRSVYTAEGDQLDTIGLIVGQLRGELVDDAYRLMIVGRIYVNRGDGQLTQFVELLDILGAGDVKLHEMFPAALHVSAAGMTYPEQIGALLFELVGAGIRLDWLYSTSAVETVFRTSATLGADEATTTEGTANLAGTTGGVLSNTRWQR